MSNAIGLQEYVILSEAKNLDLLPEITFENEILPGTEPPARCCRCASQNDMNWLIKLQTLRNLVNVPEREVRRVELFKTWRLTRIRGRCIPILLAMYKTPGGP